MDWFNFQDKTFLSFVIICGLLLIIILFLLISSIWLNSFERKYKKIIAEEGKTTRIFTIKAANNSVCWFYKTNIRDQHHISLNDFYKMFHVKDVERIKNWISNICEGKPDVEQFLEADALKEKSKSSYFCLLKLVAYDQIARSIHIETNVLKHITPINQTKKRYGIPSGAISRNEMETLYSKEKRSYGYTFSIQFFSVKQKVLVSEKIERNMIKVLKNAVYPFATSSKMHRQILDEKDRSLLIFDLRMQKFEDASKLAESISFALKKTIGINGYEGDIRFSIGFVSNFDLYGEPLSELIKVAEETCSIAQANNLNVRYYQKNTLQQTVNDKIAPIVENLLSDLNKNLRIQYRPIVDVEEAKILGYESKIIPIDCPFSSSFDLVRYCAFINRNEEIFTNVFSRMITKFYDERPSELGDIYSLRLFCAISLVDMNNVEKILPQIPNIKDIHLVLVFDEQEINDNAKELDKIAEHLNHYHEMGFELCMLMRDKDLKLSLDYYRIFDFFSIDTHMMEEIKKNQRTRLSIHALVEQLLRFKKKIIATDVRDKQSIELIIKSGIHVLSAEDICPSNDNLLTVEKRKFDKIISLHRY